MGDLTDKELKNLRPRAKLYKVTDRDGMHAAVTPTGVISFRYQYRVNGRQEVLTIGRYSAEVARKLTRAPDALEYGMDVSLAEARTLLARARRQVERGESPSKAKVEKRTASAAALTFGGWAEAYFKHKADPKSGAEKLADSTLAMRRSVYDRAIATALLIWIFGKSVPSGGRIAGLAIIVSGIAAMAWDGFANASMPLLIGDACLLLASLCWSGYGLYVRHLGTIGRPRRRSGRGYLGIDLPAHIRAAAGQDAVGSAMAGTSRARHLPRHPDRGHFDLRLHARRRPARSEPSFAFHRDRSDHYRFRSVHPAFGSPEPFQFGRRGSCHDRDGDRVAIFNMKLPDERPHRKGRTMADRKHHYNVKVTWTGNTGIVSCCTIPSKRMAIEHDRIAENA